MDFTRMIAAGALALGLSITALPAFSAEKVATVVLDENADAAASNFTVTRVQVVVPRDLEVSEASNFLPDADIVWRGEPRGDRYKQVRDLVQAAMQKGVAGLHGPQKVELVVQISRFHCLTERARAYVGGWYAIHFYLQVRDAETHQPLGPIVRYDATKVALGREAAILQELSGNTQKFVISEHLGRMIRVALESQMAG